MLWLGEAATICRVRVYLSEKRPVPSIRPGAGPPTYWAGDAAAASARRRTSESAGPLASIGRRFCASDFAAGFRAEFAAARCALSLCARAANAPTANTPTRAACEARVTPAHSPATGRAALARFWDWLRRRTAGRWRCEAAARKGTDGNAIRAVNGRDPSRTVQPEAGSLGVLRRRAGFLPWACSILVPGSYAGTRAGPAPCLRRDPPQGAVGEQAGEAEMRPRPPPQARTRSDAGEAENLKAVPSTGVGHTLVASSPPPPKSRARILAARGTRRGAGYAGRCLVLLPVKVQQFIHPAPARGPSRFCPKCPCPPI